MPMGVKELRQYIKDLKELQLHRDKEAGRVRRDKLDRIKYLAAMHKTENLDVIIKYLEELE